MYLPSALQHDLDALTAGLGYPGDTLQATLEVLIDDVATIVPSFLGLAVTVTAGGDPVTLSTLDRTQPGRVRASLLMPLAATDPTIFTPHTVVYFAAAAGAFTAMVADFRRRQPSCGNVVLDRHLTPSGGGPGIDGLAELLLINQAVGILIGRGHIPDQARAELGRHAHAHRQTESQAAAHLVDQLTAGKR